MELFEVEVRARTVELAEQAALEELGLKDRNRVEWEILQEPARGFLGVGRQVAIVRAKRKPAKARRDRGRGSRGSKAKGERGSSGRSNRQKEERGAAGRETGGRSAKKGPAGRSKPSQRSREPTAPLDDQAAAANDFLTGLLEAVDIDGEVTARFEEDLILAEIAGEETEALVGPRGSGIEALHTIAKSVINRKTSGGARLRLDIAGYGSRRREALTIYAAGLVEQVTAEGGELMLEPMNAADRKVIHDAVSQHENARSFSEGEAPQRYVVISYVE